MGFFCCKKSSEESRAFAIVLKSILEDADDLQQSLSNIQNKNIVVSPYQHKKEMRDNFKKLEEMMGIALCERLEQPPEACKNVIDFSRLTVREKLKVLRVQRILRAVHNWLLADARYVGVGLNPVQPPISTPRRARLSWLGPDIMLPDESSLSAVSDENLEGQARSWYISAV